MSWRLSKEDQANLPYVRENEGWRVTRDFVVENEAGKKLTVTKGFWSNGYTAVFNPPDPLPAIVHDFIYERCRQFDDGTPIDFNDANRFLLFLMRTSDSWITRRLAVLYFLGVSWFGGFFWTNKTGLKMKLVFRRQSKFNGLPPIKMA